MNQKTSKVKIQKEFIADYGYIEPVFIPKKLPGINELKIKSKIALDNS